MFFLLAGIITICHDKPTLLAVYEPHRQAVLPNRHSYWKMIDV